MSASPPIGRIALLTPFWPRFVAGVAMMLVAVVLQLAFPQALSRIVDGATAGSAALLDRDVALVVGATLVLLPLASAARYYLFESTGHRVGARMRHLLFGALLRKPIAFYDEHTVGTLASRLSGDTEAVHDSLMMTSALALRSVCVLVGATALLMRMSPSLGLLVVAFLPPAWVLSRRAGRDLRERAGTIRALHAESNDVALQHLANVRLVHATNQQTESARCFAGRVDATLQAELANARVSAAYSGASSFLTYLSSIALLLGGVRLVSQGVLSVGELAAFVAYANMITDSAGALSSVWSEWMRAIGATDRVFGLMDHERTIEPISRNVVLDGSIDLQDVAFSYPQRPDRKALDGVTLSIRAGEKIALVGPSGAGKSTVVALLLGFYEPDHGCIRFDGVEASSLGAPAIRDNVALVEQQPLLFAESICDNIAFSAGHRPVAFADIVAAARLAGLHEFIEGLPEGYETMVGDRGVQLSGGQRQRVAIARAALRDPRILILDEATSALDSESEKQVQEAIDRLMSGRTAILIAHRYSTVIHADRIVVLDSGRIVQEGTHDELMSAAAPLYRRLVGEQLLGTHAIAAAGGHA
ncbi:ABC transporter ATP-binding protein [Dokdonella sp.]|uniref:ABC transporter ATP-binding protein n=1 Tax=Dokdonella sp. TaxID=2291710 RepID=UPI002F424C4C